MTVCEASKKCGAQVGSDPLAYGARVALPGAMIASHAVPSTVECSTSYRVGSVTFWGIEHGRAVRRIAAYSGVRQDHNIGLGQHDAPTQN